MKTSCASSFERDGWPLLACLHLAGSRDSGDTQGPQPSRFRSGKRRAASRRRNTILDCRNHSTAKVPHSGSLVHHHLLANHQQQ